MFFVGPYILRNVGNMKKKNALKKLCLANFFEGNTKIASFNKVENITSNIFSKR